MQFLNENFVVIEKKVKNQEINFTEFDRDMQKF